LQAGETDREVTKGRQARISVADESPQEHVHSAARSNKCCGNIRAATSERSRCAAGAGQMRSIDRSGDSMRWTSARTARSSRTAESTDDERQQLVPSLRQLGPRAARQPLNRDQCHTSEGSRAHHRAGEPFERRLAV
jgi:hypothetical protein